MKSHALEHGSSYLFNILWEFGAHLVHLERHTFTPSQRLRIVARVNPWSLVVVLPVGPPPF
jgi:hypothetical protein